MKRDIHAFPSSSSSKVIERCDIIQQEDQQDLCSSSSVHSAKNQIFHFSTPLPAQKHEPYQYHGDKKKSNSRAASIISTGRQTMKSWRQKRLNILPKKYLPHVETEAYCSHCEKYITTRIRYRNGTMVWLISFILLLCTVILFWVPFYVKYFKDVAHFCPGCGKRIGLSLRL